MKSCTVALLIVSALIFASACGKPAHEGVYYVPNPTSAPAATATPDELAFARANYARHCSACHGDEGKGGRVEVESVKLEVPSLTEGRALKHRDEKFVKQITNGDEEMPAFKDKLSTDEITALVRFIRREFQGQ